MTKHSIKIKNLEYNYDKSNKTSLVIDIPIWQVAEGEQVFMMGDSGSGKTTLLNLLCGILTPTQGEVNVLGENLSALSNSRKDTFRANNIGVVFQRFNLIPYLTVLDNIRLASVLAKNKNSFNQSKVKELIQLLKLPLAILQQKVNQLSVGQQQRVAIVRAFINEPQVLLVDEPTSALDASARDAFMHLLMKLCDKQNATLIFVSHEQSLSKHFSSMVDLTALNKAIPHSQEAEL